MVDFDSHRKQAIRDWKDHAVGRIYKLDTGRRFHVRTAQKDSETIDTGSTIGGQRIEYWSFTLDWEDGETSRMPVDRHLTFTEIGKLTEVESLSGEDTEATLPTSVDVLTILEEYADESSAITRLIAYQDGNRQTVSGCDWLNALAKTSGELAVQIDPAPPHQGTHYILWVSEGSYSIATQNQGDWTTERGETQDVLELLAGAIDVTARSFTELPQEIQNQHSTPVATLLRG